MADDATRQAGCAYLALFLANFSTLLDSGYNLRTSRCKNLACILALAPARSPGAVPVGLGRTHCLEHSFMFIAFYDSRLFWASVDPCAAPLSSCRLLPYLWWLGGLEPRRRLQMPSKHPDVVVPSRCGSDCWGTGLQT